MAICDKYHLKSSPAFDIAAMEERVVDLALQKATPCYHTCLAGRVRGVCEPLSCATVKVFDLDFSPLHHTSTDDRGYYAFRDIVPPGEYLVMAACDGYISSAPKRLTVKNNHRYTGNFCLREDPMQQECILYGTLRDCFDAKPLPNVRITLRSACEKSAYACTYTNDQGQYLIYDIEPGAYWIVAKHENYIKAMNSLCLDEAQRLCLDMNLVRNPKKVDGTVSGTIMYDRCPMPHIPVFLCIDKDNESYEILQSQLTNHKGMYLFCNVPPGEYTIKTKGQDGNKIDDTTVCVQYENKI